MYLTNTYLTGTVRRMDIALIYTPTAEDADEALRAANDLAEGLGSEGENISVLGDVTGQWLAGGTREEAEILRDALVMFADAQGEGNDPDDPDSVWSKARRMIDSIEGQIEGAS